MSTSPCDLKPPVTPSWSFMEIEEATVEQSISHPLPAEALTVLRSALNEVTERWCEKYLGSSSNRQETKA